MALADRIFRPPATGLATRRSLPSGALLSRRQRALKRVFDVSVASAALLFASPLMLLTAAFVKVSSSGPVIYRHRRVGQGGSRFDVLKYRTMYISDTAPEWQITVAGDTRITPIGRRLRNAKLDEIPQLWNVIRGEMSLVGWRPHVEGYPDRLAGPDAVLIEERPGITGAATLYFRDEERLLALTDDPKRHYDDVIYPAKVRMDLEYFQAWSLKRDMACLIVTAWPSADRWLKVVPTVSDHKQATVESTQVVEVIPLSAAGAHPSGNGYRRVVPIPVHSNGHGVAPNGPPADTKENGRAPASPNGEWAHPSDAIAHVR